MPFLRRLAALALLVAAYAPLHRLLSVQRTGPAGAATLEAAETAWVLGLSGSLIVLTFAWLLARMVPDGVGRPETLEGMARRLEAPSDRAFAAGLGAVVALLASAVSLQVHGGAPTSVDEMAQMLHAAALTGGRLTLPMEGSGAAFIVQNGISVDGGWSSIYPPGHTLLLALGLAVGIPWAVGPILLGLASACFTRGADELLGPRVGRTAGLLLAVSPFWLLLGASQSSHAAAAAGLSMVLLCGLKARSSDRGPLSGEHADRSSSLRWAAGTGAAVGFAVSARPWTGLLCSAAILATLWLGGKESDGADSGRGEMSSPPSLPARLALLVVGGAPFALLLLGWNTLLFGSPLRLGYSAAFGPSHGLGFHADPWGNLYGPVEALGYTGADLLLLGIRLFEGPLPAVGLIGGALLVASLPRGIAVFAAWAGAGVLGSATYWHHGIHFGPRMLFETVPAWTALFAGAAGALFTYDAHGAPTTTGRFFRWTVLVTVVGGVALAPTALRSAAAGPAPPSIPPPPTEEATVFVHGSWASRVAARLAAAGMRRDSIETALRRNDICAVDRYARWRTDPEVGSSTPSEAGSSAPPLDFTPRPGTPQTLEMVELSAGNRVRVDPRLAFDARCRREAASDRLGVLDLEYLAWRYPHLEGQAVVAVRDLGPAGNLPVLQAMDRPAYLLVVGDEPLLMEYGPGMELLWGGAAGESGR